jgi:hypothetical protein
MLDERAAVTTGAATAELAVKHLQRPRGEPVGCHATDGGYDRPVDVADVGAARCGLEFGGAEPLGQHVGQRDSRRRSALGIHLGKESGEGLLGAPLGSSVRALDGLGAVHASTGDRIIARIHAHTQRIAPLLDPTPLAALGVLTRHVREATRTQPRTQRSRIDL